MKILILATNFLCGMLIVAGYFCLSPQTAEERAGIFARDSTWLFTSFRGNGEDGLHLAYSRDGYEWVALKRDQPFLLPKIGGKLMSSCLASCWRSKSAEQLAQRA